MSTLFQEDPTNLSEPPYYANPYETIAPITTSPLIDDRPVVTPYQTLEHPTLTPIEYTIEHFTSDLFIQFTLEINQLLLNAVRGDYIPRLAAGTSDYVYIARDGPLEQKVLSFINQDICSDDVLRNICIYARCHGDNVLSYLIAWKTMVLQTSYYEKLYNTLKERGDLNELTTSSKEKSKVDTLNAEINIAREAFFKFYVDFLFTRFIILIFSPLVDHLLESEITPAANMAISSQEQSLSSYVANIESDKTAPSNLKNPLQYYYNNRLVLMQNEGKPLITAQQYFRNMLSGHPQYTNHLSRTQQAILDQNDQNEAMLNYTMHVELNLLQPDLNVIEVSVLNFIYQNPIGAGSGPTVLKDKAKCYADNFVHSQHIVYLALAKNWPIVCSVISAIVACINRNAQYSSNRSLLYTFGPEFGYNVGIGRIIDTYIVPSDGNTSFINGGTVTLSRNHYNDLHTDTTSYDDEDDDSERRRNHVQHLDNTQNTQSSDHKEPNHNKKQLIFGSLFIRTLKTRTCQLAAPKPTKLANKDALSPQPAETTAMTLFSKPWTPNNKLLGEELIRLLQVLQSFYLCMSEITNISLASALLSAIQTCFEYCSTHPKEMTGSHGNVLEWLCYTLLGIMWPLAEQPRSLVSADEFYEEQHQGHRYYQLWDEACDALHNKLYNWGEANQRTWLVIFPTLTALSCVVGQEYFQRRVNMLLDLFRIAYYHPISCSIALQCSQRVLYIYFTRVAKVRQSIVTISSDIARQLVDLALDPLHPLSNMYVRNVSASKDSTIDGKTAHLKVLGRIDEDAARLAVNSFSPETPVESDEFANFDGNHTISQLLPPYLSWIGGTTTSENAFLSNIVTMAAHDPVDVIINIIIPMLSPEIPRNTPEYARNGLKMKDKEYLESGLFAALSNFMFKRKPLTVIDGSSSSTIMLALRCLLIIFGGQLLLSPIMQRPNSFMQASPITHAVIADIVAQASPGSKSSAMFISSAYHTITAAAASLGGVYNFEEYFSTRFTYQAASLLVANNDRRSGLNTNVPLNLLRNTNIQWPSPQTILVALLPLLQHLTVPHVKSLQKDAAFATMCKKLKAIQTTVGDQILHLVIDKQSQFSSALSDQQQFQQDLLNYKNNPEKQIYCKIYSLVILFRAYSIFIENPLATSHVEYSAFFTLLSSALSHISLHIRSAAAKVLGFLVQSLSAPNLSKKQSHVTPTITSADVINTIAQSPIFNDPSAVLDTPLTQTILSALGGSGANGFFDPNYNTPHLSGSLFSSKKRAMVATLLPDPLSWDKPQNDYSDRPGVLLPQQETTLNPLLLPGIVTVSARHIPVDREKPHIVNNMINNKGSSNNTRPKDNGYQKADSFDPILDVNFNNPITTIAPSKTNTPSKQHRAAMDLCVEVQRGSAPSEYAAELSLIPLGQLCRLLTILYCNIKGSIDQIAACYYQITVKNSDVHYNLQMLVQNTKKLVISRYNATLQRVEYAVRCIHSTISFEHNYDNGHGYRQNAMHSYQQQHFLSKMDYVDLHDQIVENHKNTPTVDISLLKQQIFPSDDILHMESLILAIQHLEQEHKTVLHHIATLSKLHWHTIEASLLSSLLNPAVGIRLVGVKSMQILFDLANTHLSLLSMSRNLSMLHEVLTTEIRSAALGSPLHYPNLVNGAQVIELQNFNTQFGRIIKVEIPNKDKILTHYNIILALSPQTIHHDFNITMFPPKSHFIYHASNIALILAETAENTNNKATTLTPEIYTSIDPNITPNMLGTDSFEAFQQHPLFSQATLNPRGLLFLLNAITTSGDESGQLRWSVVLSQLIRYALKQNICNQTILELMSCGNGQITPTITVPGTVIDNVEVEMGNCKKSSAQTKSVLHSFNITHTMPLATLSVVADTLARQLIQYLRFYTGNIKKDSKYVESSKILISMDPSIVNTQILSDFVNVSDQLKAQHTQYEKENCKKGSNSEKAAKKEMIIQLNKQINDSSGVKQSNYFIHLNNIAVIAANTCILNFFTQSSSSESVPRSIHSSSSLQDAAQIWAQNPHPTTLPILLSQLIGPWLFSDRHGVLTSLLSQLISLKHSASDVVMYNIISFSLGHTSLYSHHLILHALSLIEMALYRHDGSELLGHLPPETSNFCEIYEKTAKNMDLYTFFLQKCKKASKAQRPTVSLDKLRDYIQEMLMSCGFTPETPLYTDQTRYPAQFFVSFGDNSVPLNDILDGTLPLIEKTSKTRFQFSAIPQQLQLNINPVENYESGINLSIISEQIEKKSIFNDKFPDNYVEKSWNGSHKEYLLLLCSITSLYGSITRYSHPSIFASMHHVKIRTFINLNETIHFLALHGADFLCPDFARLKTVTADLARYLTIATLFDQPHPHQIPQFVDKPININTEASTLPHFFTLTPNYRRVLFKFFIQFMDIDFINVEGFYTNKENVHTAGRYREAFQRFAQTLPNAVSELFSSSFSKTLHSTLTYYQNNGVVDKNSEKNGKLMTEQPKKGENNLLIEKLHAFASHSTLHMLIHLTYFKSLEHHDLIISIPNSDHIQVIQDLMGLQYHALSASSSDTLENTQQHSQSTPFKQLEKILYKPESVMLLFFLKKYSSLIIKLNIAACSATTYLLYGPNFDNHLPQQLKILRPFHANEKLGLVYPWVYGLLTSPNSKYLREHAKCGMHLLLMSNPLLVYPFIHHCYHTMQDISEPFFLILSRVILLSYNLSLIYTNSNTIERNFNSNAQNDKKYAKLDHPNSFSPFLQLATHLIKDISPDDAHHDLKQQLFVPHGLTPIHLFINLILFKLADQSYIVREEAKRLLPVLTIHVRAQILFKEQCQIQDKINSRTSTTAPLSYNIHEANNNNNKGIDVHRRYILPTNLYQTDEETLKHNRDREITFQHISDYRKLVDELHQELFKFNYLPNVSDYYVYTGDDNELGSTQFPNNLNESHNPTNAVRVIGSSITSVTYITEQRKLSRELSLVAKPLAFDLILEGLTRISAVAGSANDFGGENYNANILLNDEKMMKTQHGKGLYEKIISSVSGTLQLQNQMLLYLVPWFEGIVLSNTMFPMWLHQYPALDLSKHVSAEKGVIPYQSFAETLPKYHPLYQHSGHGPHDHDIGVSSGVYYGIFPQTARFAHNITVPNNNSAYQQNISLVLGHMQTQALLWALFDAFSMMQMVSQLGQVLKKLFAFTGDHSYVTEKPIELVKKFHLFQSREQKNDSKIGKYNKRANQFKDEYEISKTIISDPTRDFDSPEFEQIFEKLLQWPSKVPLSHTPNTQQDYHRQGYAFPDTNTLVQTLTRHNVSVVLSFIIHCIPLHFNYTFPHYIINPLQSISIYCMRADNFTTLRYLSIHINPATLYYTGRAKSFGNKALFASDLNDADDDALSHKSMYFMACKQYSYFQDTPLYNPHFDGTLQGQWISHLYSCSECYEQYIKENRMLYEKHFNIDAGQQADGEIDYSSLTESRIGFLNSSALATVDNNYMAPNKPEMTYTNPYEHSLTSDSRSNSPSPSYSRPVSAANDHSEQSNTLQNTYINEDGDEVTETETTTIIVIKKKTVAIKKTPQQQQPETIYENSCVNEEHGRQIQPLQITPLIEQQSIEVPIAYAERTNIALVHPVTSLSTFGTGKKIKQVISFLSQQSHIIPDWIYPSPDTIRAIAHNKAPPHVVILTSLSSIRFHKHVDTASLALLLLTDCVYELTALHESQSLLSSPISNNNPNSRNNPTCSSSHCHFCQSTQYSLLYNPPEAMYDHTSNLIIPTTPKTSCQYYQCVTPWSLIIEIIHIGIIGLSPIYSPFTRSYCAAILNNAMHALRSHQKIAGLVSDLSNTIMKQPYEMYNSPAFNEHPSTAPLPYLLSIMVKAVADTKSLLVSPPAITEAWRLLAITWAQNTKYTPIILYSLNIFTSLKFSLSPISMPLQKGEENSQDITENKFHSSTMLLLLKSAISPFTRWLPPVDVFGCDSTAAAQSRDSGETCLVVSLGRSLYGCGQCFTCQQHNNNALIASRLYMPLTLQYSPSFDVYQENSRSELIHVYTASTIHHFGHFLLQENEQSSINSYTKYVPHFPQIESSIASIAQFPGMIPYIHEHMHSAYKITNQCITPSPNYHNSNLHQECCQAGSSCPCGVDSFFNIIAHHFRAISVYLPSATQRVEQLLHKLSTLLPASGEPSPIDHAAWLSLFHKYSPQQVQTGKAQHHTDLAINIQELFSIITILHLVLWFFVTLIRSDAQPDIISAQLTTRNNTKLRTIVLGGLLQLISLPIFSPHNTSTNPTQQRYGNLSNSLFANTFFKNNAELTTIISNIEKSAKKQTKTNLSPLAAGFTAIAQILICQQPTWIISPVAAGSIPHPLLHPDHQRYRFIGVQHELQSTLRSIDPHLKLLTALVMVNMWTSCTPLISIMDVKLFNTFFNKDTNSITGIQSLYQYPLLLPQYSKNVLSALKHFPTVLGNRLSATTGPVHILLVSIQIIAQLLHQPQLALFHLLSFESYTQLIGGLDYYTLYTHDHNHVNNSHDVCYNTSLIRGANQLKQSYSVIHNHGGTGITYNHGHSIVSRVSPLFDLEKCEITHQPVATCNHQPFYEGYLPSSHAVLYMNWLPLIFQDSSVMTLYTQSSQAEGASEMLNKHNFPLPNADELQRLLLDTTDCTSMIRSAHFVCIYLLSRLFSLSLNIGAVQYTYIASQTYLDLSRLLIITLSNPLDTSNKNIEDLSIQPPSKFSTVKNNTYASMTKFILSDQHIYMRKQTNTMIREISADKLSLDGIIKQFQQDCDPFNPHHPINGPVHSLNSCFASFTLNHYNSFFAPTSPSALSQRDWTISHPDMTLVDLLRRSFFGLAYLPGQCEPLIPLALTELSIYSTQPTIDQSKILQPFTEAMAHHFILINLVSRLCDQTCAKCQIINPFCCEPSQPIPTSNKRYSFFIHCLLLFFDSISPTFNADSLKMHSHPLTQTSGRSVLTSTHILTQVCDLTQTRITHSVDLSEINRQLISQEYLYTYRLKAHHDVAIHASRRNVAQFDTSLRDNSALKHIDIHQQMQQAQHGVLHSIAQKSQSTIALTHDAISPHVNLAINVAHALYTNYKQFSFAMLQIMNVLIARTPPCVILHSATNLSPFLNALSTQYLGQSIATGKFSKPSRDNSKTSPISGVAAQIISMFRDLIPTNHTSIAISAKSIIGNPANNRREMQMAMTHNNGFKAFSDETLKTDQLVDKNVIKLGRDLTSDKFIESVTSAQLLNLFHSIATDMPFGENSYTVEYNMNAANVEYHAQHQQKVVQQQQQLLAEQRQQLYAQQEHSLSQPKPFIQHQEHLSQQQPQDERKIAIEFDTGVAFHGAIKSSFDRTTTKRHLCCPNPPAVPQSSQIDNHYTETNYISLPTSPQIGQSNPTTHTPQIRTPFEETEDIFLKPIVINPPTLIPGTNFADDFDNNDDNDLNNREIVISPNLPKSTLMGDLCTEPVEQAPQVFSHHLRPMIRNNQRNKRTFEEDFTHDDDDAQLSLATAPQLEDMITPVQALQPAANDILPPTPIETNDGFIHSQHQQLCLQTPLQQRKSSLQQPKLSQLSLSTADSYHQPPHPQTPIQQRQPLSLTQHPPPRNPINKAPPPVTPLKQQLSCSNPSISATPNPSPSRSASGLNTSVPRAATTVQNRAILMPPRNTTAGAGQPLNRTTTANTSATQPRIPTSVSQPRSTAASSTRSMTGTSALSAVRTESPSRAAVSRK